MGDDRTHRPGTVPTAAVLRVDEPATTASGGDLRTAQVVDAVHFRKGRPEAAQRREVIGEAPLTIELVGTGASYTIMRTPGDEVDLALGFLFAEGMIDRADDVGHLEECHDGNVVRVKLSTRDSGAGTAPVKRNLVVNSSCGLCGRDGIDALIRALTPVVGGAHVSLETLYSLPDAMRRAQERFLQTGGCHAAGLFDRAGDLVALREDLGRHSAFDKVLGHALRERLPLGEYGVLLSGRTSLEMVVKAARARIALIVAVSAPSLAAVNACDRLGITLCGFARGDEVAVYTHRHRVGG